MTPPSGIQYTPRLRWPYLQVLAQLLLLYAALLLPAGLWARQAGEPLDASDLAWFQALLAYYCAAYLALAGWNALLGMRIWRDGLTPHPSQWWPFARRIRHGAWARAAAVGYLLTAALMLSGFVYAWQEVGIWSLFTQDFEAPACPPNA